MRTFAIVALIVFSQSAHSQKAICEKWFLKQKIRTSGQKCVHECAASLTDMGTFQCPELCETLCGVDESVPSSLNQFAYYLGLTADELALVAKYPEKSVTVYKQKNIAQAMTQTRFRADLPDSESDAFRHFVWAALITKELGFETAKLYLDAHEAGLSSTDAGKAMDLANNQAGILAAETLKRTGKISAASIEEEAIKQLKAEKLIVLKPGNRLRGTK